MLSGISLIHLDEIVFRHTVRKGALGRRLTLVTGRGASGLAGTLVIVTYSILQNITSNTLSARDLCLTKHQVHVFFHSLFPTVDLSTAKLMLILLTPGSLQKPLSHVLLWLLDSGHIFHSPKLSSGQ